MLLIAGHHSIIRFGVMSLDLVRRNDYCHQLENVMRQKKQEALMDFREFQKDMNRSYMGGATGVLASGLAWGVAGIFGIAISSSASMGALFIGGMFIFPLAIFFSKLLKRSGQHAPNNALKHLAIEGLGILFVGLFLAFVVAQLKLAFFYPIMLLVIGTRYLTFQTLYGLKTYWFLGGVLILAGAMALMFDLPFIAGAFIGSTIEIVFSFILFHRSNVDAHTTA